MNIEYEKLPKVNVTWNNEITLINNNNTIEKDMIKDTPSNLKHLDFKEMNIIKNSRPDLLFERLSLFEKK